MSRGCRSCSGRRITPILFVRELGARMVCTKCGTVGVDARPNWKKQRKF
jgi:hypothetical protein